MKTNAEAWLAAHTAPFKPATEWDGALPRIPDGTNAFTQVQQIRIQSTLPVDADGEFHIIVPGGDPWENLLPFWDHTMCVDKATMPTWIPPAVTTYFNPEPPEGYGNCWQNNNVIGVPSNGWFATGGAYIGRPAYLQQLLVNVSRAYQTTYQTLIDQLCQQYPNNSAYRVIGMAARVWSLQGELQNATGIIRGATLDTNMLLQNWEARAQNWVSDEVLVSATAGLNVHPLAVTNWQYMQNSSPSFKLPTYAGSFSTLLDWGADGPYGGIFAALTEDLHQGNSGYYNVAGQNARWKDYLKRTCEAAEHAFSYKIYDGRQGCSARMEYRNTMVPFQELRPNLILYPKGFINNNTDVIVAQPENYTVHSLSVQAPSMMPGSGPYETLLIYDTPNWQLSADPTSGPAINTNVNFGTGLANQPTNNQLGPTSAATSIGQKIGYAGIAQCQYGMTTTNKTPDETVCDGFHIKGTQFQPNTNMYLELVYTIEYVPTQQQTGVMSVDVPYDPNFTMLMRAAMSREEFPRIVSGHSFWSSFASIGKKIGSALKKGIKFANTIPGVSAIPILGNALALGGIGTSIADAIENAPSRAPAAPFPNFVPNIIKNAFNDHRDQAINNMSAFAQAQQQAAEDAGDYDDDEDGYTD